MMPMKAVRFDAMPTFPVLWEACMEGHLTWDVEQVKGLLPKKAKVLDVACGTGSNGIKLLEAGYDVTMADADWGMIKIAMGKMLACWPLDMPIQANWHKLPSVLGERRRFDAVICAGNSLIYAGGHWNADGWISPVQARIDVMHALACMTANLKPGGVLILDKPADDEQPVKQKVANLFVGNQGYQAYLSVRHKGHKRTAQILLREYPTGKETGTPNVAYRLKDAELMGMLKAVGFGEVEVLPVREGQRWPLWVARRG